MTSEMEASGSHSDRDKENDLEETTQQSSEATTIQNTTATNNHNMAGSSAADGSSSMAVDGQENPGEMDTDAFDEAAILKTLTSNVRDQDDLEREISHQGNLALIARDDKGDEKRIERANASIRKFEAQKKAQQDKFAKAIGQPALKIKIREEIARLDQEIQICRGDIADCNARMRERHQQNNDPSAESQNAKRKLPGESQQAFLIRTGKITPLAKVANRRSELVDGELANVLVEAEEEAAAEEEEKKEQQNATGPRSHKYLPAPGISSVSEEPELPVAPAPPPRLPSRAVESEFSLRPRKKRKVAGEDFSDEPSPKRSRPSSAAPEDDFIADAVDDEDEDSDDYDMTERPRKVPQKKSKKGSKGGDEKVDLSQIDDGNEESYQTRLAQWIEARRRERRRVRLAQGADPAAENEEEEEEGQNGDKAEWLKPHPRVPDLVLENDLALPGDIHQALYDYQKTGIQWMSELYARGTGGILGDEMGLGKTIQMVSFVAALHHSGQLDRPVIVVAPATLLRQWVNEFHRWWPSLRVSILHSSGSGLLNVRNEDDIEDEELSWRERSKVKRSSKAARKIVDRVVSQGHVLVTTYAGVQTYGDILIPVEWGYAVLDEGHKIRNPHAAITIYCKELRTSNRIILSGTPMQNNLTELWSLFDFVFPMRLGNLADFRRNIELPIRMGGYANASNLEVMTAERCAGILKDTISPYLLQRMKADVAADLPKKTELVLFCDLTREQRAAYERYLDSGQIHAIMSKKLQALAGIDILRKICNHPDLLDAKLKNRASSDDWGAVHKSGKMAVLKGALQLWKRQGHKTLLFSQGVLMLDILEKFLRDLGNFRYLRMDGGTAVKNRQALVDEFNGDPELDVFLLTTKVGGLGVNLTGANRVVIFDPDWNPSTDVQARERAWRLGQKKDVTIYRLMLRGTIEEKIYHRQIFKQFLSNKVLKDPKQRTALDLHNLHDLFTLGDANEETETGRLFKESKVQFDEKEKNKSSTNSEQQQPDDDNTMATSQVPVTAATDDPQDLLGIDGVAKLEDYQTDSASEPPPTEDDRIMQGIFARAGVHSAHQHDEIMGTKKGGPSARDSLHRREVDRVAAAATASLRRAHEEARRTPAGTVTDTGEFSGSTATSSSTTASPAPPISSSGVRRSGGGRGRGAGGPSSGAILANLANRQGLNNNPSAPSSSSAAPAGAGAGADADSLAAQFSRDLIKFIQAHGGRVPTKAIKDHFDGRCRTPRRVEVFKEVLNRVARMDKTGSTMRGIWTLRDA
ncbi:SNF2 family N-terminal domain-containing protein [Apiospora arundinis]|uniref:SNF2 family N-terminal domain-containing protein n=1 Tax=Apiospora arundinis TaxID=335852 RepID=A0ABR2HNH7_9PEZI